jgi:SanA protein
MKKQMYEADEPMSMVSNDVWELERTGMAHRRRRPPARLLWLLPILLVAAAAAFPFLWHAWVHHHYDRVIYSLDSAPVERVAIVFGARVYGNDRLSGMLRDRVETAVRLYHAGKVQKILVSGDNQTMAYNEPGAMMAYAIRRGVPAEDVQPDYGGRRTYDTCYRANAIFQLDAAILVTQAFHLPRALFLCRSLGVQAVGVIADLSTYHPDSLAWSEMREIPAVLVALFDTLMRRPPPVMGAPIPID